MDYKKLLSIKMDLRDRNELIAMANDFINYGYRYNFFKTYDYPKYAIEKYGENELIKCWEIANDYMRNL